MDLWFLLSIIVVLGLLFLFFLFRRKKRFSPSQKVEYLRYWSRIQTSDPRTAIMDADKLLDRMLAGMGYSGSLGEKLKHAGELFKNINGIWSAHKLRNRLAHELDIVFSDKQVKEAIKQFEQAYRDLGLFS